MRRATRKRLRASLIYAALTLITAVVCFPLLWAVGTSIRPNEEMLRLRLLPEHITGAHYAALLTGRPMYFETATGYRPSTAPAQHFLTWFVNSVLVTVTTTVLCVAVSTLGAYSLTRLRFVGQSVVPYFSLLGYMTPSIIYVFPLFLLIVPLGLADRLPSLVLGYLSITLPFSMWLMWAFLKSIPLEVEEAGLIDGASRFQVFRLIVLPLALPGIIATSIFSFIVAWNDYLIARIFMNSITQLPLTVGVMHFFEGVHVDWGLMMAAAVLMTLPLAVLFMFVQRHLVVGFGAGGVKG
ncbi:MAG: carbohydrate ABC transporter permease [Candidatus Rokuibacteriota bacterium]|nr:MAG: carbohydrate ABC transporter permease [Candidatus Rokubacteria bacterium]